MAVRSKTVDLDRRFAEGVREARLARGMTQEQLTSAMAERGFGFYQATVYKIEQFQRRVSVGEAIALASILGDTVEGIATRGMSETRDVSLAEDMIRARLRTLEDVLSRIDTARREMETTMVDAKHRIDDLETRRADIVKEITATWEMFEGRADGEHQAEA